MSRYVALLMRIYNERGARVNIGVLPHEKGNMYDTNMYDYARDWTAILGLHKSGYQSDDRARSSILTVIRVRVTSRRSRQCPHFRQVLTFSSNPLPTSFSF